MPALLSLPQVQAFLRSQYPQSIRADVVPLLETAGRALPVKLGQSSSSYVYIEPFLTVTPKERAQVSTSELIRVIKLTHLPQGSDIETKANTVSGLMKSLMTRILLNYQAQIQSVEDIFMWLWGLRLNLAFAVQPPPQPLSSLGSFSSSTSITSTLSSSQVNGPASPSASLSPISSLNIPRHMSDSESLSSSSREELLYHTRTMPLFHSRAMHSPASGSPLVSLASSHAENPRAHQSPTGSLSTSISLNPSGSGSFIQANIQIKGTKKADDV